MAGYVKPTVGGAPPPRGSMSGNPMSVIVDALVRAGLVDASEVNDIVQIVFDLKASDMPAMYVRKLFDVNQLALAIDTSSRGGGISIERESVEPLMEGICVVTAGPTGTGLWCAVHNRYERPPSPGSQSVGNAIDRFVEQLHARLESIHD